MTIDQLDQFLLKRANQNVSDKNMFHDAKLVLINRRSDMFLGIQFAAPHDFVFFVRYMKDNMRHLFKISFPISKLKECTHLFKVNYDNIAIVEYSLAPKEVKAHVAACIKQALTMPGVGIDMFTYFLSAPDTNLIDASETYEEAAIEMDLAGLGAFE